MMNELEKLTFMYEEVEGKISNGSNNVTEASYIDDGTGNQVPLIVCTVDGLTSWIMTKEAVLFNYVTRDM